MRTSPMLLVAICAALPTQAHEFWIEPASFRPEVRRQVDVALMVGDGFPGEPFSRKPQRTVRFEQTRADPRGAPASEPIAGRVGAHPAGRCAFTEPGNHILIFRSNHAFVELEAEKFESYLREKGLEGIITQRAERNASNKPGREAYSRCAKALVQARGDGPVPSEKPDRAVGLPLEIVALSDVHLPGAATQPLTFQLLHDGKPLASALVLAQRRGDKVHSNTRTDADGRVTLTLEQPGVWLVAAVHMTPAPDNLGADWESLWASLTFELAAAPVRP